MIDRYLFSLNSHESFENDENNLFSFSFDLFLEMIVFKRVSRIIIDDDENLTSLFIIVVAHDIVHKIICFFTIILFFSIKCFQRFCRHSTSIHDITIINYFF